MAAQLQVLVAPDGILPPAAPRSAHRLLSTPTCDNAVSTLCSSLPSSWGCRCLQNGRSCSTASKIGGHISSSIHCRLHSVATCQLSKRPHCVASAAWFVRLHSGTGNVNVLFRTRPGKSRLFYFCRPSCLTATAAWGPGSTAQTLRTRHACRPRRCLSAPSPRLSDEACHSEAAQPLSWCSIATGCA